MDKLTFHKGYPVVPEDIDAKDKARDKRWSDHSNAAWKAAEPIMAREAVMYPKERPIVQLALVPDDLPKAKIPAFPGAEGGGMWTAGGRGGKVFVVTNLNDDGPGSYREALEAGGARIVVFNVAGVIHLNSPVHIRAPYISIEGQSAPGDGICVAGYSTKIDTHDVIVRYMRYRRGSTQVTDRDDALGGDHPIGNIIIDHCSISWGLDETISLYRQMFEAVPGKGALKLPLMNTTIQWTIISEGLNTFHHAFGGTWGGRNSMFAHNLFACNTGRNASIGMNYDFNFINNVLFNWQHRTLDGGDNLSLVNVINNYYKPGPGTNDNAVKYRIILPQPKRSKEAVRPFGMYHVAGNIVEGNDKVTADNWDGGVQFPKMEGSNDLESAATQPNAEDQQKLIAAVKRETPFPMPNVTILPAKDNYEAILAHGGATLPIRDPVDLRVLNEVKTGVVPATTPDGKGFVTDIKQVGGWPNYKGTPVKDSDSDGMPDDWELAHGLNPHDASDAAKDLNGDGYTNIEKFLNGTDTKTKIDWSDLKNNVNALAGK
ncbi:MAG: hypothetical protein JWM57_3136 [Phycisphaerales bacterium]|nr:hypothetical protein [Phycisphaerales bacterium]